MPYASEIAFGPNLYPMNAGSTETPVLFGQIRASFGCHDKLAGHLALFHPLRPIVRNGSISRMPISR